MPGLIPALILCGLADVAVSDEARLALGRKIFIEKAQPSCRQCHSLKDAEALGTIGPDLDHLQPGIEQVITAVRSGIGIMPSFAATLSPEQIEAVAHYVNWVTSQVPR
jgi:mono/diheme cytochrome c family protein